MSEDRNESETVVESDETKPENTVSQSDYDSEKQKRLKLEAELAEMRARNERGSSDKVAAPDKDKGLIFKGEEKVRHDLFRLEIAGVRKNVGYDPDKPIIEEYDHVHFYHTFDSNGRAQMYSNPSAGHIHEVKWERIDGVPTITFVGPPLDSTSRKLNRNRPADPGGKLRDKHNHKGTYKDSEIFSVRKISQNAQAAMALRANQDAQEINAFNSANKA